MNKFFVYNVLSMMVLLASSCASDQSNKENVGENSDVIEISKIQFQSENMAFDKPTYQLFEEKVHFTGNIVPTIDGVAKLSIPIDGVVHKIFVKPGQWVNKGDKIVSVGGNSVIDIQQQYSSSSAKIKQLKADYERAKILYRENIKTESEFLLIESNYKSELGIYSALKLKLQNMSLNLNDIENGLYQSSYIVTAPINGQVVDFNFNLGQFITSDQYVAEIVNNQKVQLQISIFEKELSQIKEGQDVVFNLLGDKKEHKGKVSFISQLLNDDTKSVSCYADIHSLDYHYTINQIVNGDVIIKSDSIIAVPVAAVIGLGELDYVLTKQNETESSFQLIKEIVNTGRGDDSYVELIDYKLNKEILISGTYNVNLE